MDESKVRDVSSMTASPASTCDIDKHAIKNWSNVRIGSIVAISLTATGEILDNVVDQGPCLVLSRSSTLAVVFRLSVSAKNLFLCFLAKRSRKTCARFPNAGRGRTMTEHGSTVLHCASILDIDKDSQVRIERKEYVG